MIAPERQLAGIGVVVTRPAHQAEPLCRALEARGASVIRLPLLAIAPPPDPVARDQAIDRLASMDWAVFVSPNAVDALLDRLDELGRAWPAGVRTAAVGAGTAAALEARGVPVASVPPGGFDSEALLAQPDFQHMNGRHAMLVRGEGGRELLRSTLEARGGRVETLTAYRRVRPAADPVALERAWVRGEADVAVVTSGEALDNLLVMAGPECREAVLDTGIVVLSDRVAGKASGLGFRNGIVVATGTSTEALAAAVERWATRNRRQDNP